MTKIPPKPKNDQNTPKTKKMTKIPSKTKKMTKIPSKHKNDQNISETQKMTKVPPKPKK